MSLLVLSIVALALGPGIVTLAGPRSWVLALVDGFVIVTIGGIAVLHILPHAVLSSGSWALVGAAAGLFGPMLLERKGHAHHDDDHGGARRGPTMILALLGIALHAFLDGSAFAGHDDAHGIVHAHGASELLALAVVLHRVPEGLAIWWLVRAQHGGAKAALVALSIVAVATVLGARFGDVLAHGTGASLFSFVQSVVTGSLLHVVVHHAPPSRGAPSAEPALRHDDGIELAPALGAFAGVALLFFVSTSHPTAQRIAHELAMGPTFLTLAREGAPALVVAYVVTGLVHAFLPRSVITGSAKGEGLSRALHLVAVPELGLAALLLSWSLLGGTFTLVRVLAAIVTAAVIGGAVTRLARRSGVAEAEAEAEAPVDAPLAPWRTRLWAGLRYGLGDAVDRTMPWILAGLAVAAFAEPLFDGGSIARWPPWIDVPVFAALGVPIHVCASGATPLVAVLLHKGVSPGAALAFLLTGPATNRTTFGALRSQHGRRAAALVAAAKLALPTAIGWSANLALARERPEVLHRAAREHATTIEIAALVALGLLVAIALVRRGPRGMVAELVAADPSRR